MLVCIANHTKWDWYAQIKKLQEISQYDIVDLLKCYSRVHEFNNLPRKSWITIIFGMCIES